MANENGVRIKLSGVLHHNGISIYERYHAPLRTIYRKVRLECPDLDKNLALQTILKALNDVLGPKGLVPSYLVFGTMPRYTLAGLEPDRPNQPSAIER